jgi:hypothetical protein
MLSKLASGPWEDLGGLPLPEHSSPDLAIIEEQEAK